MKNLTRTLAAIALFSFALFGLSAADATAATYYTGTLQQVASYNGSTWATLVSGGNTCYYVFPTASSNTFTAMALTAQAAGKPIAIYSDTACSSGSWGSALALYVTSN